MSKTVKSPRFWINTLEWLDRLKILDVEGGNKLHYTLPVNPSYLDGINTWKLGDFIQSQELKINYGSFFTSGTSSNAFIMLLGHDFYINELLNLDPLTLSFSASDNFEAYLNANVEHLGGIYYGLGGDFSGFSIYEFDFKSIYPTGDQLSVAGLDTMQIGSMIVGEYFDMDAPELNLEIGREYADRNESISIKGKSLTNSFWNGPARWGRHLPWDLKNIGVEKTNNLLNTGRRTWSLTWKHLDEQKLFPKYSRLNTWFSENFPLFGSGQEFELNPELTLLQSNDWFSKVYLRTMAGSIPFVFQPDGSTNKEPDNFAICTFEKNSLKVEKVSINTFDISVNLVETW